MSNKLRFVVNGAIIYIIITLLSFSYQNLLIKFVNRLTKFIVCFQNEQHEALRLYRNHLVNLTTYIWHVTIHMLYLLDKETIRLVP